MQVGDQVDRATTRSPACGLEATWEGEQERAEIDRETTRSPACGHEATWEGEQERAEIEENGGRAWLRQCDGKMALATFRCAFEMKWWGHDDEDLVIAPYLLEILDHGHQRGHDRCPILRFEGVTECRGVPVTPGEYICVLLDLATRYAAGARGTWIP